jgi:MFS family permease
VYQPENAGIVVDWRQRSFWVRAWQSVSPNVWYLGVTSLLTDISSEMVTSVLPMYLVLHLGLSPLAFGTLDGLYNGVTAITRWASGVVADRWRRHKEVAAAGYLMSVLSRVGMLAAGSSWTGLAAAIAADRLGKGIRTVPRDALISLSSPPRQLAYAFGVHRALDATGAMLGPIVAFSLLAVVARGFDVIFVVSSCVAVVGVGVLLLFVQNASPARTADDATPNPSLRAAVGLLRIRDFRVVTGAASALALVTISDGFVYLALQQRLQFTPGVFPLLYVGTALSYLLLAVPAGALADRIGRDRMFLLGHGVLLLLYAAVMAPASHVGVVFLAVALLGAYYAATDGVVVALASGILPASLRGSGLALLTTAISVAKLMASIAFGWIWTHWSSGRAIVTFELAMAGTIAAAAIAVGRRAK